MTTRKLYILHFNNLSYHVIHLKNNRRKAFCHLSVPILMTAYHTISESLLFYICHKSKLTHNAIFCANDCHTSHFFYGLRFNYTTCFIFSHHNNNLYQFILRQVSDSSYSVLLFIVSTTLCQLQTHKCFCLCHLIAHDPTLYIPGV